MFWSLLCKGWCPDLDPEASYVQSLIQRTELPEDNDEVNLILPLEY